MPATTTSYYLLASSTWLRKKIQARDAHADDPELSMTLWDTSLSEVGLGFLEGPFDSVGEVQKIVDNDSFVCSRRFVIIQGNKPRVIDVLRESCINEAFTIVDRLCLHDIDFVASMLASLSNTVSKLVTQTVYLWSFKTEGWCQGDCTRISCLNRSGMVSVLI